MRLTGLHDCLVCDSHPCAGVLAAQGALMESYEGHKPESGALFLRALQVFALWGKVPVPLYVCASGWSAIRRKVDVRLLGKLISKSHGGRPVHQITTMVKWIRSSRLSTKNSLSCHSAGFGSQSFEIEGPSSAMRDRCLFPESLGPSSCVRSRLLFPEGTLDLSNLAGFDAVK